MKSYKLVFVSLLLLLSSCEVNQDIETFDRDKAFVHFAVVDKRTNVKEKFMDSIDMSFVFEDINVKSKRLAIPINVIGAIKSINRSFKVNINKELSTIDLSTISIEEPTVSANKTVDSVYVNIRKTDALRDQIYYLYLELEGNENFEVGHVRNKSMQVAITNRLPAPVWWTRWKNYFGPYQQEIFQLWIQMYYLGSDPSPDLKGVYSAPFYYWDNMPPTATASTYPVTFMYINRLREYLLVTPVYPNGDTTKPRIYLP